MFSIAICDDEKIVGSQIENILLDYSKRASLKLDILVFFSGESLYKYIESGNNFDLIYLDIEMKCMNGIEVGKRIRNMMENHKTEIVYISGKDCYDRQLFDVQPLHFIPKPISPSAVIEDLKLAMIRADKLGGVFTYKKENESYRVPIKDILYFKSIGREIKIVTMNNEDIFYGVLQKVLDEVKKYQFIQIHRSYIVNYSHISIFRYEEVTMINKDTLPISQSKRKEIKDMQLVFEQGE